jgi:ELWxxDGT repeat protein
MKSRNYAWVGLVAALAAALALGLFWWANVKEDGVEEITRKKKAEAPSQVTLKKGDGSGSRDILRRLKPGGLSEIDVRQTQESAPKEVAVRETGAAALRLRIPGVQIDYDAVTGAPKNIVAVGQFLTAADEAAGGEALDTVNQFVDANKALFGHSSAALSKEKARVTREDVTAHNKMKTLVWQQELDGIPLYKTIFKVNLTGKNEMITVGSHFMADPAAASGMSPQQREALVASPPIEAPAAISLAAASLNDNVPAESVKARGAAEGTERKQGFTAPGISDTTAQLTYLPMSADELKLAWDVTSFSLARNEMFRTVVDAASGEVLCRTSLTADISDATYRIFTTESPTPFSPGHESPSSLQPAPVNRVMLTTPAMNTTASPNGWIDDGSMETNGNNVDAHTDTDNNNSPDLPRPNGGASRVFDFPLNLTQEPGTYKEASVTQLFYWCNFMHDRMYEMGFTESAGNFQVSNFGRGGNGNDPVQADAQDGSGTNNANFSTPADGGSGRMQMYLWTSPTPDRDGSFEAEVVLHEYGHGVSNRLVGGGTGMSALSSRGMGEGWSDFYGLALTADASENPHGNWARAGYSRYLSSSWLSENYYYGARRYSYSTDMLKNPHTFKDIDPTQVDWHTTVPRNPTYAATQDATQVHYQGTVWAVMLWDMRANLILKHGFAIGNDRCIRLVTDGLKLSPVNPNFVQARDGIIQATLVSFPGDLGEVWTAFAKRGMGQGATAPASSTTTGVVESYTVPDGLQISDRSGWNIRGNKGGPFTPVTKSLTLSNNSGASLNWSVNTNAAWLSASPSSGALAAGANVVVTITTQADAMAPGFHSSNIVFTNTGTSFNQPVGVRLYVTPPQVIAFNLNSDPGWTRTGEWAFGAPTGSGGTGSGGSGNADPAAGATGTNVFGVNLAGNHSTTITGPHYVTMSTPVNLSIYTKTRLRFQRWLNTSALANTRTTVEVSTDGTNWREIFVNPGTAITDNAWQTMEYDISSIADQQSAVYVRWGYQTISSPGAYAGWNIDDVAFLGEPTTALAIIAANGATEGDGPTTATLQINIPQATDTTVMLSSSDTGGATVPASVTLPALATSTTFEITPVDDVIADGPQAAVITASAAGMGSGSKTFTVEDNETSSLALTVPATTTEGAGTITGTVTRASVNDSAITVTLVSSDTTAVSVPPKVVIPSGQASADFSITVVDDNKIDGLQNATISADVVGWTGASAPIAVQDNENLNLAVTLSASITEGATGSGMVSISGSLTTPLVISLSSNNSRLTVPATATIAAGATSANFTLTAPNDAVVETNATVAITASNAGFTNGSSTTTVVDNDLHHFGWATITSPKTRGLAFSVTITAQNQSNSTVAGFTGSVLLSGAGAGGAVSMTPPTTTAFTAGVWTGNVTINTIDTNVVLTANDGGGRTGASNAFNVTAGPLDHFAWNTISSPKSAGTPFTTTITAQDVANNTVTSFVSTAALTGYVKPRTVGTGTSSTTVLPLYTYYHDQRSQCIYLQSEIGAAATIRGLSLNVTTLPGQTMNNWTIRMKHTALSSYATNSWESTGWTTVYQANTTISATGQTTFTFTTPFAYDGTSNLMVDFSFNNSSWTSEGGVTCTTASANRTLHYFTDSVYGDPLTWSGTSSPTPTATTVLPNLMLQVGTTFPVSPSTSGAFTAGVWTGNVTVNQTGTQLGLRVTSGTATGDSNLFDVTSTVAANAQSVNIQNNTATAITLTGQDSANPGATLTYNIVTNPTYGVVSGTGANRTYTPTTNYSGSDSFTFTVANGAITSAPATVSITVLPAPGEIAIEQPVGTGLTDGVTTVDYGSIPILSGTTRTFTVRNVGATNIVVSGITKDGTNSAEITLGTISASTIAAGSTATFDVSFAPGALGPRSAAIHVLSNDLDEGSFDIALTATGSAAFPEIAIEQPAGTLRPDEAAIVDYGLSALGTPVTQIFTIKNTGGADLSISGVTIDGTGASQFSAGTPSATLISPAGSATLAVTFTPTTPGAKLAALHVLNNDSDEGSYDIELQGIGTVVPGPVSLARDINPLASGSGINNFVVSGGNCYYVYNFGLYRTDGTAAGTTFVSSVNTSSNQTVAVIGSTVFYVPFDSTAGTELWTYNGTTSALLADINPGSSSSTPGNFVVVGSTLFFTATTAANGTELWKSDGTAAGTVLVKDIVAGTTSTSLANLVAVGSTLYFTANDGTNGVELWKSDGTSAGTVMVANINATAGASSSPANLTAVGSTLYFSATNGTTGIELYKTDGTTTAIVLDISSGSGSSSPGSLVNWGGTLYFRATTSAAGTELWKSDGTGAGTVIVRDIFSGTSSSTPANLAVFGGALYFSATDSTANGVELWKTDGTSAGTTMVANINATANGSSSPTLLTVAGSSLYFYATDGTSGSELWKTDGTALGTVRVEDINLGAGSSGITTMVDLSGILLFGASDGVTGAELWRSNGTAAGTYRLSDVLAGNSSSAPNLLTALGSTLIFTASDGVNGTEVWSSDGTNAGTSMLKDIATGLTSSSPSNLTVLGTSLFFSAFDFANGTELWKTDGTAAGTVLVANIFASSTSSSPTLLRAMGGTLYFAATDTTVNGQELWRSDGTAGGTVLVKNINPVANSGSSISGPAVAGNLLFFSANDGTNGAELWMSDGSGAGTVLVKDIHTTAGTGSSITNITAVGSTVFFSATDGVNGQELWKSDGTAAGTVLVKDINPGSTSTSPANLVSYNGVLYFAASDGFASTELWRSDGTMAGTYMLMDINPGASSSTPANFREHNGILYFSAFDSFGTELWRTDGTVAGTFQVKDINPGISSSSPGNLFSAAGRLYFSAITATYGTELWRTDGTAAGTQLVSDINLGTTSSNPANLMLAGSRLFFSATVTGVGTELFSLDLGVAPELAAYEGAGTAGPERQDNVGVYAFGTQSAATTRSFTLKNTGTGYLYVSDIVSSGPQAGSFAVVGKPDPSVAIQPGAELTFSVIATLEGPVSQSAVVSILCNDADESSFDIPVTLTVDDTVPPVISAPATYLIGQPGQLAMSLPDVRGIVIYSDNRAGEGVITQDPIPGDVVLAIGKSVVVTFTATDSAGNASNTVTTTVRLGLGQPDTGDLAWARSGSGVGPEGTVTRAAAAPDGGAYVAGAFSSSPFKLGSGADQVTLTPAGGNDVFIARFAKDGTLLWARSGGSTSSDSAQALVVLSDGSVALGGIIGATATFSGATITATTQEGFVARYLPDGTLSWLKGVTGTGSESVTQLVQLGDGNIAIAGSFSSTDTALTVAGSATVSNIGSAFTDVYFAKLDRITGSVVWVRGAGSSLTNESTTGLRLVAMPDGGLGVAGAFLSGTLSFSGSATTLANNAAGVTDWWAGKYDTTGALLWATAVGGGTGSDSPMTARTLSNGDLILAGTTQSATSTFGAGQPTQQIFTNLGGTTADVVIARVAGATGLLQWIRRAGSTSTDGAAALAVLPDDSLVLTGTFTTGSMQLGIGEPGATTLVASTAAQKVFIARFNSSSGTLRWAKNSSGTSSDSVADLAVLWDGDIGIAGIFTTPSAIFGLGEANATTLVNPGLSASTEVYFAKFNRTDGSLDWATSGGSGASDAVHGLATLANGSALVVGSYQPTAATFGLGKPNATTLANADTAGTNTDLYFARFHAGGAEPPAPPIVALLPASGLTPNTMTFNASIDTRGQDTTVLIDYGPTTDYGTTVSAADVPAGLVAATRSLTLTGLTPLTTMHFRLRATNEEGTTASLNQAVTTYADAEIAVEQPAGTGLADGVSTVSYGAVPIGSSVVKTFTIRNEASATSTLTGLTLGKNGAAASDYALGSLGATSLAPGESTTFDVTYTPSAGGARAAAIQIASNDGDENPFDIALTGNNLVDSNFNSAADIPITAAGYTVPAGRSLGLTLGFIPPPGTALVVVSNTSTAPISGTFLDLPQGALITATFGGQTYIFQANYFGGDGNDLVLTESFTWTWTKGSSSSTTTATYGTQGTAAVANTPGGRSSSTSWTDSAGNLWMFGGTTSSSPTLMNDLWRYDRSTAQWTWMKGSSASAAFGTYGTLGTAAAANTPGARYGATGWADGQGRLWLFGGFGFGASGATSYLNDLWRYDTATNNWTWLGGSTATLSNGTYGTQGTANAANIPSARWNHSAVYDPATRLVWLFGGFGLPATGTTTGSLNDLWRYHIDTGLWTWMKGGSAINVNGTYGTKGVAAAANTPGTRNGSGAWLDPQGKIWIFGGTGNGSNYSSYYLGDLWRYDPLTSQWAWMSGSATSVAGPYYSGIYGTQAVPAAANAPGYRQYPVTWTDVQGRLWMLGGVGLGVQGSTASDLSDLWFYDRAINQWAWVKGAQSIQNNGIYGALGAPAAANLPGARDQASAFTGSSSSANLWLFGGFGYAATGNTQTRMNDVWTLDLPNLTTAATLAATAITDTTVTLNGNGTSGGTAASLRFLISTAANLAGATPTAAQSIGAGSSTVAVNLLVTGLAPATPYYFAAEVFSNSGRSVGSILSFTTLSAIDAWRLATFGSTSNTGSAADDADPDGDGMTNLTEYIAGTNPNSRADVFKVGSHQKNGGSFTLTTAGKSGRTYALQRCTSLVPSSWSTVTTQGPLGSDGTVTLTDPAAPDGTGFYRIQVTMP